MLSATASHGVNVFSFFKADFEVQGVLHSERDNMSNNDCTHAMLSLNAQLIREHELYRDTVKTPRGLTVA